MCWEWRVMVCWCLVLGGGVEWVCQCGSCCVQGFVYMFDLFVVGFGSMDCDFECEWWVGGCLVVEWYCDFDDVVE